MLYARPQLVRLEVSGGDAVLMSRSNLPPSFTDYDLLDLNAWTSRRSVHNLATQNVGARAPMPAMPRPLPLLHCRSADVGSVPHATLSCRHGVSVATRHPSGEGGGRSGAGHEGM
jgi:hypothetical protein